MTTDWTTPWPRPVAIETLTYRDVAKCIDHSLLRPELTDEFIDENVALAVEYGVASITCRPVDVAKVAAMLRQVDTDVVAGTVVGFPHGDVLTETKVFEAARALDEGAREVDMVINIGALKSGRDEDVLADIAAVVRISHDNGAIVKVIFENAYLTDEEKIRACHATEAAGGDFVKTSTGFAATGATHEDLRLMRENTGAHVQVKAAGGVRTLDALMAVMDLGVTRIGATATKVILDDFMARKQGMQPAAVASSGAKPEVGAY